MKAFIKILLDIVLLLLREAFVKPQFYLFLQKEVVESIGNPAGIGQGTGLGLRDRDRDRDGIGLGHYRLRANYKPKEEKVKKKKTTLEGL